jgi:hypothetical protein
MILGDDQRTNMVKKGPKKKVIRVDST